MRPLTFDEAKRRYVHRYTMEHVPAWALNSASSGKYYAPQYRSDREWYDNTEFPGEGSVEVKSSYCHSSNQSWPLGTWLDQPYEVKR